MSDMEAYKGKARRLNFVNKTFKQKVAILRDLGHVIDWDDPSYDWFECDTLVCHGDDIFEVLEKKEFDSTYCSSASSNKDGTFDYTLVFYNGGTCFGEMLGESYDEIKEQD